MNEALLLLSLLLDGHIADHLVGYLRISHEVFEDLIIGIFVAIHLEQDFFSICLLHFLAGAH